MYIYIYMHNLSLSLSIYIYIYIYIFTHMSYMIVILFGVLIVFIPSVARSALRSSPSSSAAIADRRTSKRGEG